MITYQCIDFNNLKQYKHIYCLPEERWKTIDGFDSKYQVSDYGRIRSVDHIDAKGSTRVGKIIATTDNGNGYKNAILRGIGNTEQKALYLHRLVATYFIPNPDNLPQVNHKPCGLGKHDNRFNMLEWCTEKENIVDAHKNGQMDNRTKIHTTIDIKPDEFIKEMYTEYKTNGKVGETAKKFGVSRTTLSSIVNKRSRVKITDEIDELFKQQKENKK
jgi:predicted DNA-binding protein (UPF0251 family)